MPRKKRPVVEYRHYNLALSFPVLLLTGERWRISEIKSSNLHFHNCLEIGICLQKSGTIDVEGVSKSFREGDVTCIPRYIPHTTYSSPGEESLWEYIFVDPEELFRDMFKEFVESFEGPLSFCENHRYIMNREEFPQVWFLANSIVNELKNQRIDYQTSVKGLMLSLYIEFMRIHDAKRQQTKRIAIRDERIVIIANAIDFIYKNYMHPINIEDLADNCHLSVSHFRRTFHSIIGVAPLEFLNSTRINEACKLLRSTGDTIISISEQVGFRSVSSFNRCFIKFIGVSPRVWRNTYLQSETISSKSAIMELNGWM
ncbi:AraC family transcriptional regulator [Candidatus Galacturonibacter soehngenii]|uniref:Helix-turn-helix transcriptional regulator n=1 Tax=Candidatus Galacturonatibacter soehngenii TaxID=2307010 RepID=A0A7V7UCY3_9FIRM|nr:helix-turn-helix domain-containing protein [Candidatus Galacturonibacter soehngenii]KAB1439927.1 helix-turn-helix transcriptional regulator [Candidatus Galacturonibacter soehngenii]MBA4685832.1 AraC family transcriptional regulator [Candidatus Galacturonibacter soehngenii]